MVAMMLCTWLTAQENARNYFHQLIEVITENLEGEEEFDYIELGELIEEWLRRPIDINSPQAAQLAQWNIISDYDWQYLVDHIIRHGPLLDVLELQAIKGFDPDKVRLLQSITRAGDRGTTTQSVPLEKLLLRGQNEFYLRGGRTLEKAKGYLPNNEGITPYEGSPDKIYFRYRHRYSTTLSYGVTGEKDAGESMFSGSNPRSFDFQSAHIALQHYRPWLPAVMLGDFTASFGQGLIMHSGFGAGKSSLVASIKRTGTPLRPYTSVDENNYLRGAGISIKPKAYITITAFVSQNQRDGNLVIDTLRDDQDEISEIQTDISSLQTSSLHRTRSEIEDKNAINLTQTGLSLSYKRRRSYMSVNALHSRLDIPLNRAPDVYNQFYFNGDQLTNLSADYGLWLGGVHFFGETAVSDNGAIATVNGLLAGIDRKVNVAVLFRSYDKRYQSLTPNAFGESSLANNELGFYTGIEITPTTKWKIQLYHDMWKHHWLRFNIDAPTDGNEIFGRITYTRKRRLEVYAQYRSKNTQYNSRPTGAAIADIVDRNRSQYRIHFNNMLNPSLQLRTRLEWTRYRLAEGIEHGFMIYQDFVYKPLASPWQYSGRVGLFDTDGYNSRVYTFENDLIYYYAIPAFNGRGLRYYLTIRYKGIRNLTAEVKFAQTRWLDVTSFGSGNDQIQGNRRSEIRAQLIYRIEN